MKKHLLFLSNLYPNPARPNQATFNYQQVKALTEWFDISVLSPIPWLDRATGKASKVNVLGGISVNYPTYWYTPGVFRSFYGQMMFASVGHSAQKLHRIKPFDLILGSWLYPDGWAACRLAKKWRVPCYLKVHGTDVNRLSLGGRLTKASLHATQSSHGIVCVSQALKERMVKLGVSERLCHVIYNGVDSEIFFPQPQIEARKKLGFGANKKLILYVGNLLVTKGLGELAISFGKIARECSDVQLVVLGSGDWRSRFLEIIRQQKVVDKVQMLGTVGHRDIGMYMNAADVLCLPSYMEGTPNVILEALACNKVVVATGVGGIPELARNDMRIVLVQPKNVDSLTSGLARVLKSGPSGGRQNTIMSWRENAAMVASVLSNDKVNI